MERVCEELEDAKAEIEKLRAEYKLKVELSESLKRAHNEQLKKIQESSAKIEKQAQELNEKADEISVGKQVCEDLKSNLKEKEGIIKHLSSANDKLRFDSNEKLRKWEEENRELVYALNEANSKKIDLEQKVRAFEDEIESLKEGLLSVSQKKSLEGEKRSKRSNELRQRDDVLHKLEEEKRKVEDEFKWKKEQFKHLEEAHEKLRDQLQALEKDWEREKSTLLDEISMLQDKLDSQTRISEDLQRRLQMCNHALAHEESRRKILKVQLSESKSCFENVFSECEEAKSKIELLTDQRDTEIATLRDLLGTKETLHKEMVYQIGKLKQENQELQSSLKEFQEAQIQEAGNSSLSKTRNKRKGLEQMHGDCSRSLRDKEAKWSSQLEKMRGDLNDCRSELEMKNTVLVELNMELEDCHSLIMQLESQNEEMSMMILVLKSVISEAEAKLANENADLKLKLSEKEKNAILLTKQLEMTNGALVRSQTDTEEEREKIALLSRKVESLNLIEQQHLQLQKELEMHNNKESSTLRAQDIEQEREKVAYLSRKVEFLNHIEQQKLQLQKELEMHNKESSTLKAQDIEQEREKVASLSRKVESLNHIEQQKLQLQKELERHKERLKESSTCQLRLKEKALQMESDLKKAHNAIQIANKELDEKFCEASELELELQIWKSVAERLKTSLEENHQLRLQVEASLLAQVAVEVTLKQEKESLAYSLEEKDRRMEELQQQLVSLDRKLKSRETEIGNTTRAETAMAAAKEKISENLQREIEWLEETSVKRELETAILVQINAERTYEHEKHSLHRLAEKRDHKIVDLQLLVKSMEERFKNSTSSFLTQVEEKQAEINLLYEAWEKVRTAEVLKEIEIQEKNLIIVELENELEFQEKREEIEAAELEAKQLEMRKLIHQLETGLSTSNALVHKLESEKRNLLEEVTKLLLDRKSLLDFVGRLSERIGELSCEDVQMMGIWGRIVKAFDNNEMEIDLIGCDDELFDPVKENMNMNPSPTTKKVDAVYDERSPLRALNN